MKKTNFLFYTLLATCTCHLISAETSDVALKEKVESPSSKKAIIPTESKISLDKEKKKKNSFADEDTHENHDEEEIETVEVEEGSSEENEIPQEEVIAALRGEEEEDKKKRKDDLIDSKKKENKSQKTPANTNRRYALAQSKKNESNTDFLNRIMIEFQNGDYNEFLYDIDQLYLDSTEHFVLPEPSCQTTLSTYINNKLPVFKQEYQNLLQYFVVFHPTSSIAKTLTLHINKKDIKSLNYIPFKLEKIASKMILRSKGPYNKWVEILENIYSYAAKRQLLDSGKWMDPTAADTMKRLHLALDFAQEAELTALTQSMPSVEKRVKRHYQVYYKTLYHGYKTQDLLELIHGEREPTTYEENLLAQYAETLFWIEDENKQWSY